MADVDAVRKVLGQMQDFPDTAKNLLLQGLPSSLRGTGGMLFSAALQDAQTKGAGELRASEEAAQAAKTEIDTCQTALSEAERAAEATAKDLESAEASNASLAKQAKTAEHEHKSLERDNSSQAKVWDQLREDHSRARSIADGSLRLLSDGGWADDEIKAASVEAVIGYLNDISAEKALVAAAADALGTRPDGRKRFDSMAVEAISESISGKASELQAQLDADADKEKHARSELLGLWAIAECAREDSSAAAVAEVGAQAGHKRALDEVGKAQKRLKRQGDVLSKLEEAKRDWEVRISEIEEAVAAVGRLQSSPAEAAEAEVPANDEEASTAPEKVEEAAAADEPVQAEAAEEAPQATEEAEGEAAAAGGEA